MSQNKYLQAITHFILYAREREVRFPVCAQGAKYVLILLSYESI